MKKAFTLVEAIIAATLASLILAAMLTMFRASRKMTDAGDLSAALADAAIAMEIVHRDLTQVVQKSDPAVREPVIAAKDQPALQFVRALKKPDGKLDGVLVVYHRVKTAAGNFRLMRRSGGRESPLPGVYSRVGFAYMKPAPGPFLRVTLHVVGHDVKRDKPGGLDEAVLSCLVKVDAPEMLGTEYFVWDFLDDVNKVELLKGELGF